jgi:hypothetical protein
MVSNARCHELFNRLDRLNTAPGSDRRTVQCSRGASEIELSLEGPILKESIDKPGVEDISSAGGIDHWNTISRSVVYLLSIPRQHTFVTQRRGRETASIAALHLTQCHF